MECDRAKDSAGAGRSKLTTGRSGGRAGSGGFDAAGEGARGRSGGENEGAGRPAAAARPVSATYLRVLPYAKRRCGTWSKWVVFDEVFVLFWICLRVFDGFWSVVVVSDGFL